MMTSGANATNSSAYLRLASAPPPAQRISIRMLRPSVQPNCCNPPTNAFTRVGYSESFVEAGSSTPMRRIRSGCCACVVSGHTATEVPISVMKSRRLIAPGLREGDRTASNLALGAGGRHFAAMSALGHVWTAPWQELSDVAAALVGCGHV